MKRCTKCGQSKSLEAFHRHRRNKDGRRAVCKACESKRAKAVSPEENRRKNLKKRYGITLDEYSTMLAAQNYRCAICRTDEPKHKGFFVVDHCHTTGRIRGLLCQRCNYVVGLAGDDPELFRMAFEYLK